MLYGGIDEAGYGPLLGPLCVGAAVFNVEHTGTARPCLWSTLANSVKHAGREKAGRDKAGRIAIDDSKKLKGARNAKAHPLTHLERGVLTMLASMHEDRSWLDHCTDIQLLQRLGIALPDEPWFQGEPIALPLGSDTGKLRIDAAQLARTMASTNTQLHHLHVRALSVPEYNDRVQSARSKSWVNFEAAASCIERIWASTTEPLHLVMDRHGGRTCYQRELHTSWPQAHIDTKRESPEQSDYTLTLDARTLHLHIRSKADADHLPVALASMAAKLVRELLMQRLNRFFTERMPDLAPTAGYVQDGRRWLQEVDPVLQDAGFQTDQLVRCR